MKKERTPTAEEFEKLLRWFNSDHDTACRDYIWIQTRLIQIFASRGCSDAEILADEVFNRVANRIDSLVLKYPSAAHCCLSFVKNVYREWIREQQERNKAREPPPPRPAEELEVEDQCLQGCLNKLEDDERDLFVRYFKGEGRERIINRQKLAAERGISINALRIQAFRLMKLMRLCIKDCLASERNT